MRKRLLLPLVLHILICGCSNLDLRNYDEVFEEKGQAPIIVDYYAAEIIRPGTSWKIYLHVEDKDGDVESIATTLYQVGFGYYPTDFIRIRGKSRKEVIGYLALKTPRDRSLTLDEFTMEVLVRDNQRNRSEKIMLPLTFADVEREKLPSKWQKATENRLGVLVTGIKSMERIMRRFGSE